MHDRRLAPARDSPSFPSAARDRGDTHVTLSYHLVAIHRPDLLYTLEIFDNIDTLTTLILTQYRMLPPPLSLL
jgi:hypothetical protein